MFKKGDTLVEVALAVGIFSMVAIAVAAVLSSSTSGAQTALETTLTREEIDTQAEALRFIQTSYAVDRNETKNNKFYKLWHAITSKPYNVVSASGEADQNFLNYAPTSCSSVYESDAVKNYAFIINPRALGAYTTGSDDAIDNINQVILRNSGITIPSGTDPTPLQPASIYPRLLYQGSTSAVSANTSPEQDALISDTNDSLYRAEGIYVVAVRDQGTTDVVDYVDGEWTETSAFYDFYIRSCWYGTDADQPSTISTVIRLYDPDVLQSGGNVIVRYEYVKSGEWPNPDLNIRDFARQGPIRKATIYDVNVPLGWTFNWLVTASNDTSHPVNSTIKPKTVITNEESGTIEITLKAQWHHTKYQINYHPSANPPYGGYSTDVSDFHRTCYQDQNCAITLNDSQIPVASGYRLAGWCSINPNGGTCPNDKRQEININFPAGNDFPVSAFTRTDTGDYELNLYPIWRINNETIAIQATWSEHVDYDTMLSGTKSNGVAFEAYYSSKVGSDLDGTVIAQLNHDCTGTCQNETFILNTYGSRSYYYYICRYSPGKCGGTMSTSSGVTVNVYIKDDNGDINLTIPDVDSKYSGKYKLEATYNVSNASGSSGQYWNVFAYKDGRIVTPGANGGTTLGSLNTSY